MADPPTNRCDSMGRGCLTKTDDRLGIVGQAHLFRTPGGSLTPGASTINFHEKAKPVKANVVAHPLSAAEGICPTSIRTLRGRQTRCILGYVLPWALQSHRRACEARLIVRSRPVRGFPSLEPKLRPPKTEGAHRPLQSPKGDAAGPPACVRRQRPHASCHSCHPRWPASGPIV